MSRAQENSGTAAPVVDLENGQGVAFVDCSDDDAGDVAISFSIAGGHLPAHVRRDLVEAVFALPELRNSRHLEISMPLGDAELLSRLRTHCARLTARAAGATRLLDGDVD